MFADYTDFPFYGTLISGAWLLGSLMIWTTAFMIKAVPGKTRIGMVLNAEVTEKTVAGRFIAISGNVLVISGILLFTWYMTVLWISLERAPMRTLGETRLWYSTSLGFMIFLKDSMVVAA